MALQDKKCMCLIEDLTVAVFFFAIVPFIFRRQKKWRECKCIFYYVDATHFGLYCCKILFSFSGLFIEKLNFSLVAMKADNGQLLQMKVSNEELVQVQKGILQGDPLLQEVFSTQQQKNPSFCVYLQKQSVAFTLFAQDSIWRLLYLIHVFRWSLKRKNAEDCSSVIFARPRFGKTCILDYAAKYNTSIIFSKSYRLDFRRFVLCFFGEHFLRKLYHHGINFYQRLFRYKDIGKTSEEEISSSPKLMVEYYGFLNLDNPELISNLFFLGKSKLKSQDILMTFNLPSDPLDREKYSELTRYNINFVALNPKARLISQVPLFLSPLKRKRQEGDPLIPEVKESLRNFYSDNKKTGKWLLNQINHFDREVSYWCDFLKRYNVKAYISWYNCETQNCIISHALNRVGGVSALYQRSHEESSLGSPEMTVSVDLAFGFSEMSFDLQQVSNSCIPYYVIVGYIGEHRFPLLKDIACGVREQLMCRGVKKILAYFDENSCDDLRWAPGHEFVRESYTFILTKILQKPDLGLVIKPKNSDTLRQRLGEVSSLLDEVLATGRCYIFEKSYPPAVAGLASDIAIHGHAFAVTAGLESALNGVRTLLLDREGCPTSKMYKFGKGKIVFGNWNTLWQAIEEHWKSMEGVPGFGDWSAVINDFDPFRDGRALERVNTYLEWIIEGYKAALSKETILADAAERYGQLWGKDKVKTVDSFRNFCNRS